MSEPPRPEPTPLERRLVQGAFRKGAETFAARLAEEASCAETVKAAWLEGRCSSPRADAPEGLAEHLVAEAAYESWRLDPCACGHNRGEHFSSYLQISPEQGACQRGDCPCDGFVDDPFGAEKEACGEA